MGDYPEDLLPHQSYPNSFKGDDILSYNFVRETQEDIYAILDQELLIDDVMEKVIAPQRPNEVFEFSVNLYGFYNETHVGIRASEEFNIFWTNDMPDISAESICYSRKDLFPLYLKAEALYEKSIDLPNTGGELFHYQLSFSHKPTRANYWHFQLCTKDSSTGICISRDERNARVKLLAKHILEQYILKAICFKSEVNRFNRIP